MNQTSRPGMKTIGGMSVRAEIDLRLQEARTAAIEEVIVFLGGRGYTAAAEEVQRAAFGEAVDQVTAGSAS